MKRTKHTALLALLFVLVATAIGQEPPNWDNQLFIGNKFNGIVKDWKISGEFQVRLDNNYQGLDRWFMEGAGSYMPTEHWEFVPDFRLTIKETSLENRPGFGILRKDIFGTKENLKHQLVHQVKYQADFNGDFFKSGLRYVFFYNVVINKKLVPNVAAGVFYRWSDPFTGIEFYRFGGGLSVLIDQLHAINFSYYLGISDTGTRWTKQGIFMVQLVFYKNRNFKYIPAKYISF